MPTFSLKGSDKAIKRFYDGLEDKKQLSFLHEGAVAPVFSVLLNECARRVGYSVVQEVTEKNVRYDGVVLTPYKLRFGVWEAKDSKDDLQKEIDKKMKKGYPSDNILFQSPSRAILIQNGQTVGDYDIRQADNLAMVLERFFNFVHPQYDQWERAVSDFKDRVPQVAQTLDDLIEREYQENRQYKTAFEGFLDLCRQSINPNLSKDAVEEMLIQHILTERIFKKVLDNPDFVQRNAIARELEGVVKALIARDFSRESFLKPLEPFYGAIEMTAATLREWSDKQAFLNTVYEQFFQGFSTATADTHGIVYTPQPIVNFMVQSVERILQREWGKRIADPDVHILDPFVGTGNFILRVMKQIIDTQKSALPQKYASELHCNELMLLPYYIASMNIEHAYYEAMHQYAPFEGVCLVDTFEAYQGIQMSLPGMDNENTERVRLQNESPVFVVIGNPPYNAGQVNENDNNKNRKYPKIDKQVQETYVKASKATNRNALSDPYVKAFWWASDRIGDEGMVAFVTNNGFLDSIAFDGMRQHLQNDFDALYLLDLGGNVRKNPKLSGTTHNVFGIQVGVVISLLVRRKLAEGATRKGEIYYARMDEFWRKEQKYAFLEQLQHLDNISWQAITPNAKYVWLTEGMQDDWDSLLPLGTKEAKAGKGQAIFEIYSRGAETTRDAWVYNFNLQLLYANVENFIETYNSEVYRWQNRVKRNIFLDDFVIYDDKRIKWSSRLKECLMGEQKAEYVINNFRQSLYRPFTKQNLYFDHILTHRQGQFPHIFPTLASEQENRAICMSAIGNTKPFHCLMVNVIPDLHLTGDSQCFPFYTYDPDGTNRRENISDWALAQFRTQFNDASISKWDIFYYVYAVLHDPHYRTTYAQNLKRELPRIALALTQEQSTTPTPEQEHNPTPTPQPTSWGGAKASFPYEVGKGREDRGSNDSGDGGSDDSGDRGSNDSESKSLFHHLAHIGKQLADLHLNYEQLEPYALTRVENNQVPPSLRVEKMKLITPKNEGDLSVQVNSFLTLTGIPRRTLDYKLGNRSALEWVIEQYQVSTDKRSGIRNDPNRLDDEAYIVRLIGQVVRVSLETLGHIAGI